MPALLPSQKVEFLRSDQAAVPEQTKITCLSDLGAYEVTSITVPATAAAAQGDFFYIENQAGDSFAVWLDIDANGTAPLGPIFTGADTAIEVDIVTGGTAADNKALVLAAITAGFAAADMTAASGGSAIITVTQDLLGVTVDAAGHNAAEDAAGSFTVSVSTQGAASNRQNKYLQLQQGDGSTSRYVWLNVGAEGVDPSGTGTALEAAINPGVTAAQMASALASAIHADTHFNAEASGADVYVWAAASGNALNAADVDTGFTVSVLAQGYDAEENLPSGNLAASNPQPSAKVATT